MEELLSILQAHPTFREVEQALDAGGPAYAEGAWGSASAYVAAALAARAGRPVLSMLPHVQQAEEFAEDVALFSPGAALFFPAWEAWEEDEIPDAETLSQRLAVLKELSLRPDGKGRAGGPGVIVAPVQAVLQPVPSPWLMAQNALVLRKGVARPPEEVTDWLVERDFQSVRQVEVPGEFCRRGGILDVFPYAVDAPVRIEFFGDEIESLRNFDPGTQLSLDETAEVTLTTVSPRAGRAAGRSGEGRAVWSTLFDYLPNGSFLILKEPAELMDRARALAEQRARGREPAGFSPSAAFEALKRAASQFPTLHLAALPGGLSGTPITFHVHSVERFGRDLETTLRELNLVVSERSRTIVFCSNAGERERLVELLGKSPVLQDERFEIRLGRLNHGFDWTDLSLALLAHHEIFHRYRQRRTAPRYRHTRAIDSFYELDSGDLVVHSTHGIGVYRGMELLEHRKEKQECLKIEYADRAILYVPASRIELVQKYIGPAERQPPLSRLGGKAWLARKQRTERAVRDLAADLLRTQAVREAMQGIAHSCDNDWQREFETAFPYEDTEDQITVVAQVKGDMERLRPMDRLICGDVGYGKTEIAVRAAFAAVMGGYQVAVLVPTTVLAAQHTQTFCDRMADYPIVVAMLSRFVTRADQERVLAGLAEGGVDIVIGTHRLLQPDVRLKELGLVIIDEEQRFGVAHKERLKNLRERVDVLTLTATPIPRTLHMSLLGIRDISSLQTPLPDRLAIHTRLMRYDPHRIRQAILHEMARDGQVFFVHNRVETIEKVADELRELIPEARISVGHGQMPERELADVMTEFVERRADVLVCTCIIESGLDIPNANTILINQADMFGLADLHQLRGRVGRYKHRAYAYLLLPSDRPVTPVAEKRLKAIEEFSELGAGFRIAMRDLEIRGAGNILGPEQSGHIAAVGYDMYCRLLERAVRTLKNEPTPTHVEVALSLGLNAFIPESYVAEPAQRIDVYRKLHRSVDLSELESLREEMRDRFGELPPEAERLLAEARLRQLAEEAAIESIAVQREESKNAQRRERGDLLIIWAADAARVARVLTGAGQAHRAVDERTFHLRVSGESARGQRRAGRARISGEFLVSFLIRMLEQGLSSLTVLAQEPRGDA